MPSARTDSLEELLESAARTADANAERARRLLAGRPIVLFGTGGLGRSTLRGLRDRADVVAFSDNNPERWNTTIDGVPVCAPEDARTRFGDEAAFVIPIWNAGRRRNQTGVTGQLRDLGVKNIVSFVDLFRCFPDVFLPYFAIGRAQDVLGAREAIDEAYARFDDDRSRRIFRQQLAWRITGEFETLGSPGDEPQYFPPDLVRLRDDEAFVDCGAFDGDTLRQFIALTNGAFRHYWALEPDQQNYAILTKYVDDLPDELRGKVTCSTIAASDRRCMQTFDARGSASSTFVAGGGIEVECAPLDELVPACTFIKLDVEGAEPQVLEGSRRLIRECAPLLAVSAYHTQSHLWELPLLVHAMNPSYRLVYREHNEEGFDLVLYAIPPERRA